MSNLTDFAKDELTRAGYFDDEMYDGMLGEAVVELVEKFAEQGHSGMSAAFALRAFGKVANFEPLTPLTGDDDEWNQLDDDCFQNKRCSRVFKDADGRAYDIKGRVFREPSGACFTNSESRVDVTFPYTPATEIVDRPSS